MSRWKRNDTLPSMEIMCFDAKGLPADLSDATEVLVFTKHSGTPLWEKVVPGPADGLVVVPLTALDTDVVGTHTAKVRVTWPSGARQHYPPADRVVTWTVTR